MFHRDDYACVDCGSRSRIECDHIVPVERGGRTVFDNLQTLCRACHISKTRRENGATEGAIEWTRFLTDRKRRRTRHA